MEGDNFRQADGEVTSEGHEKSGPHSVSSEKRKSSCIEKCDEEADAQSALKAPRKTESFGRDLESQIKEAKTCVREKEDHLRKLKLVRTYRTKWETQDLGAVTAQWLRVSQESLEDLRAKIKDSMSQETGQELTLSVLIGNLGLDPVLLKLDEEEDCFITP